MGIVSIRSVHKELAAGVLRVIDIKGMPMQREFNFVQLQGQEGGRFLRFYAFCIPSRSFLIVGGDFL